MTNSLPSKKIAVVDVPEVEQFEAKFVYNFFTPDEKINAAGTATKTVLNKASDSRVGTLDNQFLSDAAKSTPRFIRLTWKPTFKGEYSYIAEKVSIQSHLNKIHNEESFANDEYTNVEFHDSQLDRKAAFYVEEAIEQIEKRTSKAEQDSPLDIIKSLNEKTSEEITGTFLADVFNDLKKHGVRFFDSSNKKEIIQSALGDIKNVRTAAQLNNKFIKSMIRSVEEDRTGFFADEASALMASAAAIQTKAISSKHSSIVKGIDYDLEILDYIGYRKIDSQSFDPAVQVIGYIINKQEIGQNGRVVSEEIIVIENPTTSNTIDLKIKYGSSYRYTIKSVAYMEYQAEDNDANSVIAVSFLVCSKLSPSVYVHCEEYAPPPWPADFNIAWDYREKAARLMWSFPVNSQRDIKRFQIFRRKTIYEPFQLIKMFDFDDSLVRSPYYETPEHHLIELLHSPKTYFLDKEFNKESKYIYSICSIDAHGFTSNYSSQYEISFDKFSNKLIKKLISTGGAPKQYPNMYLKQDTFVDTIKDSGHKRLQVYFNPEYLSVVDGNDQDLKLLRTDIAGGKYRLQLINADLQTQKVVEINILDKRESKQKK